MSHLKPRLLLDLQGCQTRNSRHRGIGRYSLSLTQALLKRNARSCRPFDMVGLLNGAFPEAGAEVRRELAASTTALTYREIAPGEPLPGPIPVSSRVRGLSAAAVARALKPDIIHVSSLVEGYEEGAALTPYPRDVVPGAIRTATVYDLIPLLFSEKYLSNREYEAWYRGAIAHYASFDLLFAISEATRRDLIEHLGIDSDKVINISAAVDSRFRRLEGVERHREMLARRLELRKPFILYTGGGDHRKNLHGAIDAFSLLPSKMRAERQLAIVCRMDGAMETSLLEHARKRGLAPTTLVLTGYVNDDDLVLLYNLAELFIFPSFYEGFGLPLLEAMSCGTPVLAGDNSSLPEVVGRADLLFDASNPQVMADKIVETVENDDRLAELRAYSLTRAQNFSWEKSAEGVYENLMRRIEERDRHESIRRPRVAMTTPLPPARSGISEYSADLLHELVKGNDVELFLANHSLSTLEIAGCSVRPVAELAEAWPSFDTVVYQMGNSTFHTEMLSLLPESGGVLVLHDVYLSDLKAWLDLHEGRTGLFARELEAAHGSAAVKALTRKGVDRAVDQWPVSGPEIAAAETVIVHSRFAKGLVEKFYPQLSDKVEVVRQPRSIPLNYGNGARAEARQLLGIDPNTFLVVSLGIVGPTKKIDTVVDGFEIFAGKHENACLALVGDAANNRWTANLKGRIEGTNGRVSMTGHVPVEQFNAYCQACDVAVQLRATTRGETSAALLQLMGCGKRVIVNAFGDFADYPDDVVVKIGEQPDAAAVAQALVRVAKQSDESRQAAEKHARDYVDAHHSHQTAATAYGAVIRRTMRYGPDRHAIAAISRHLSTFGDEDSVSEVAHALNTENAKFLAAAAPSLMTRLDVERRLLFDVSHTYHTKLQTGIQRVVRELTRASYKALETDGFNVQAFVREQDGRFRTADAFALELEGIEAPSGLDTELAVRPNDRLLMLDSSWFEYDAYTPLFQTVRKMGGTIHTCVYDLVPLRHPELTGEGLPPAFDRWFRRAAQESDSLLCISRAIADEVVAHLEEARIPHRQGLQVNWFHLGSNLPAGGVASVEVTSAFSEVPCAIMVGTVEVRKRHAFALDVMERLWAEGSPARLIVLGKMGWHVEALSQRIRTHAEFGKRLIWIEKPSDADLAHGYAKANVLLFPSLYEGYGLPVAEALRAHLPVVASDIPVLREVGGDAALYGELENIDQWVELVKRSTRGDRTNVHGGHVSSWDDAAHQVRRAIQGAAPYRVLL